MATSNFSPGFSGESAARNKSNGCSNLKEYQINTPSLVIFECRLSIESKRAGTCCSGLGGNCETVSQKLHADGVVLGKIGHEALQLVHLEQGGAHERLNSVHLQALVRAGLAAISQREESCAT